MNCTRFPTTTAGKARDRPAEATAGEAVVMAGLKPSHSSYKQQYEDRFYAKQSTTTVTMTGGEETTEIIEFEITAPVL